MDIYIDRIKHARFANRKRVKGKIFNRLVGINVATAGDFVTVEPIYMALAVFEQIGKVLIVSINLGKPWLTIVIMPNWPFVVFVEESGIQLEEEE